MTTITNRNGTLFEACTVMIPQAAKYWAREQGLSLSRVLTEALEKNIAEDAGGVSVSSASAPSSSGTTRRGAPDDE